MMGGAFTMAMGRLAQLINRSRFLLPAGLVIAVVASGNGASAAPPARTLPAAEAYVMQIYEGLPKAFNFRKARYAPALQRLLDREAAASKGDEGLFDANPFCGCQDTAYPYHVLYSVHGDPHGTVKVEVSLENGRDESEYVVDLIYSPAGWLISDLHGPRFASLVSYIQSYLAGRSRSSNTAPADPAPSDAPVVFQDYAGSDLTKSGELGVDYSLSLRFDGETVTGSAIFDGHHVGKPNGHAPVTGKARQGHCDLAINGLRFVGPCDTMAFTGQLLDGRRPLTRFAFYAPSYDPVKKQPTGLPLGSPQIVARPLMERMQNSPGTAPGGSFRPTRMPPARPSVPPKFTSNEWFDFLPGSDAHAGGSRHAGRGQAPRQPYPPPPGARWFYGRDRWAEAPGGRCDASAQLLRNYCFSDVIGYLKSHPGERSVTVITLSRSAPLGAWISNDTPISYKYVEIARSGSGFKADEHMHGTSKVQMNGMQGRCDISPVQEGFFFTGIGGQPLREAALYRCQ